MGKTVNQQCQAPTRATTEDDGCPYQRGMPRPLEEHPEQGLLPLPWSQLFYEKYGETIWGRVRLDEKFQQERDSCHCLLCGEKVVQGVLFIITEAVSTSDGAALKQLDAKTVFDEELLHRLNNLVLDHGVLHERCAKMTIAHCQTVKKSLASGTYRKFPFRSKADNG